VKTIKLIMICASFFLLGTINAWGAQAHSKSLNAKKTVAKSKSSRVVTCFKCEAEQAAWSTALNNAIAQCNAYPGQQVCFNANEAEGVAAGNYSKCMNGGDPENAMLRGSDRAMKRLEEIQKPVVISTE